MPTWTLRARCACLLTCLLAWLALLPGAPLAAAEPTDPVGGPRLTGTDLVLDAPADIPAPPEVGDGAWLIADATTGEVLATRNPHAAFLPASTLKVLTALTLLPHVAKDRTVEATPEDVHADGTRVGLVAGLPYTADQLYQAMLMSSANDATYALARLGGGRDQTLAEMNELAHHLGALDTVAGDPSGLDAPGQQTSVYDLALIGRAALANPQLMGYAQTLTARFPGNPRPGTSERETFEIGNHNVLLTSYPGAIGLKNGWTTQAKRTFIGAATRDGRTYLVTELAGDNPGFTPTVQLLDWAFAHGAQVRPVGRLVAPGEVVTTPTPSPTPTPPPAAAVAASPTTLAAGATTTSADGLLLGLRQRGGLVAAAPVVLGAVLLLLAGLMLTRRRRTARSGPASARSTRGGTERGGTAARPPLTRADVKRQRSASTNGRHAARRVAGSSHRARGRHGAR